MYASDSSIPRKRAYPRGLRHKAVTAPRSAGLAMIATRTGKPSRAAAFNNPAQRKLLLHRQTRVRAREQVLVDQHVAARVTIRARRRGQLHRDQQTDNKRDRPQHHVQPDSAGKDRQDDATRLPLPKKDHEGNVGGERARSRLGSSGNER